MKKIFIACLLGLSMTANAELISTDWQYEGDGQAVLNTETGKEWLKLNNTVNKTTEYIVSEMHQGGLYSGWRLPTSDEVETLTKAFGFTVMNGTRFYSGTRTSDRDGYNSGLFWESLMGSTDYIADYSQSYVRKWYESIGRVSNHNGQEVYSGTSKYYNGYSGDYSMSAVASNYYANPSERRSNKKSGLFLVSDGGTTISSKENPSLNANNPNAPVNANVPITGSLALLSISLLGFRRKV
jgi:hypothetical protein